MPSPWLMARKSGLYCRVFVPTDLRPVLGQRFLVRALDARDRDQGRLIAAQYALAIGDMFCQLRKELSMAEPKVEDIIRTIRSGGTREAITIKGLVSATGAPIEVKLDTAKDLRVFKEAYPDAVVAPGAGSGYIPAIPAGGYHLNPEHGVLLSQRVPEFETQQKEDSRTQKYIDECLRAVAILIDLCGDLPPDDYTPTLVTHFKSRVKWLPPNAVKSKANIKRWANDVAADSELPWFAVLYLPGRYFACRQCGGLAYASQKERVGDRSIRHADRIRKRLGWVAGIAHGDGGKPVGMHWQTFWRLKAKHDALVQVSCYDIGRKLGFLHRLLEP